MLHVCYGNQLEVLADQLAEHLDSRAVGPLEPELIAVQGHAVSRWLALRLATDRGISANNQMLFPAELLWLLFRRVLPEDVPPFNGFSAQTLAWRVLALLQSEQFGSGYAALAHYLETASPISQWQLAERLGRQFEQYLIYRPDWIQRWESGGDTHWQAALWRRLLATGDDRHWLNLRARLVEVMAQEPAAADRLPARISLFGLPSLSEVYLGILQTVAAYCDVRIYALNYSSVFWADIVSDKERTRRALSDQSGLADYMETGNSLLASLGRQGRAYFGQLLELDALDEEVFHPPVSNTLLGQIQSDIFYLREGGDEGAQRQVEPSDDSIQIHVCHSPMREVEVLHDRLLDQFDRQPDLDPAEVLVLVPDIETYTAYIEAVFGSLTDDRRIPFRIADCGQSQRSSLIETFFALLDMPFGRYDATGVSTPLFEPAIQKQFGLSGTDVDQILHWVRESGIRWGIDAADMSRLELPVGEENTWRRGSDRLILGHALPAGAVFDQLAPCGPSDTTDAQVVGRLRSYLERVFALRNELSGERTVIDWSVKANSLLDRFFASDAGNESELRTLRDGLTGVAHSAEAAGYSGTVALEVYRHDLAQRLAAPSRGFFGTGAVTFAALAAGRCLPAKLVCLLGMNDSVYPRADSRQGFDLIAQYPRVTDRRQREEDRQVFLDAVLCARQQLYISYTGRDIHDDRPKPPSTLISELLDYIDRTSRSQSNTCKTSSAITIQHPLQAFNERYFQDNVPQLFSYARELVRSGDVAVPGPGALVGTPLTRIETDSEIALENLVQFFTHPARVLLRDVLDIRLESADVMLQTREPVDLDYYTTIAVREVMLAEKQQGAGFEAVVNRLRAAGKVPVGTAGVRALEFEWYQIAPLHERLMSTGFSTDGEVIELALDVAGTHLTGTVSPLIANGLVHYSVMNLTARDRIRLWLSHLALCASDTPYTRSSQLFGPDQAESFDIIAQPHALLTDLIAVYQEGLTRPLPFFPRSAWEYVSAGGDSAKAAARTWAGNDYAWGESEDVYNQLAFRDSGIEILEGEFEQLAARILGPLQANRVVVR